MKLRFDSKTRRSLLWWLPVLALALYLKHGFSIADTLDLQWMLQPLADLLSLVTGHRFERLANGDWYSNSADVRLVKGCAGINFMLMSLLAYAWAFRPDHTEKPQTWAWYASHALLLAAVCVAAWATALFANTLRILLAMALQTDDSVAVLTGLGAADLHRFIGLAVYLPVLTLQMLPARARAGKSWLWIPPGLYGLVMLVLPLVTGHALNNPEPYVHHVAQLLAGMILIQGGLFVLLNKRH
jgi:exosortase K